MRFADNRTGYALCRARLVRRRTVVARTLQYIEGERRNLENNRTGKILPMLQKRRDLLDKIRGWYVTELKTIDSVLPRLNELAIRHRSKNHNKRFRASA